MSLVELRRFRSLIDAEIAIAQRVVVAVGAFAILRSNFSMQQLAAASKFDRHRLGPIEELCVLDVLEAVDALVGKSHDLVAGSQPCPRRRAVRLNGDGRRRIGLARKEKHGRQQNEGKQEVRGGSPQHNSRARVEGLAEEGPALLLG